MSEDAVEAIKGLKLPKDLEIICDDIKTCGRKELSDLLKLRLNYLNRIEKANRDENDKAREERRAAEGPKTEEQLEAEVDKELEMTIQKLEKNKKRAAKKQREIDIKQDIRKK
jgi:AdoMet-dependent rRNA methyltransferase SPB1